VTDWDAYQNIWEYTFSQQLRANPKEYPLFICEPSHNTREQREKMAEIAFEQFHVPAFFTAKNAVLSS
jgi:actin-related protein